MKKLLVAFWSLFTSFFCTAFVHADAAVPDELFDTESSGGTLLLVIALALVFSSVAIAVWILVRSGRRK